MGKAGAAGSHTAGVAGRLTRAKDRSDLTEASNSMTKRGNIDTGRVVFIVVMLREPRLRECGAWGVEASLPAPFSIAPVR